MKYRTFRNVVAMGLFLALGGTCYGCYAWWHKSLAEEEVQRAALEAERQAEAARLTAARLSAATTTPTATSTTTTSSAATTTASHWLGASGLREVDKAALSALQRPVVDKIKDATKGKPYKINVYADDGARFNRLKIDLDRDEKEDESWTIFADGHIERKVSTKDNGNMDAAYRLEMSGWFDMSAPTSTTATTAATTTTHTAAPAGAGALRAVDNDVFALIKSRAVVDKIKDATKGKPYKVNLYSDDGQSFQRAKLDLDRDDKWDESWTWKGGTVERQVSPGDNEQYSELWVLTDGTWRQK